MSEPLPLFTFRDPDGRFQDDTQYVDADGSCVVVGRGGSGGLWTWRPESGAFVDHPIPGPATVSHAAAWHDGRLLALTGADNPRWNRPYEPGNDPASRLWDLETGEQVGADMAIEYGWSVCTVALWSKGDRLIAVTGTDNAFALTWNALTGEPIGGSSEDIGESVDALALAEVDGVPVFVVGGADEAVRVWEVDTDRDRGLWTLPGFVEFVGVTELAGRPVVLAAGGFDDLRLWDLRSATELPLRLPCGDSEHEVRSMLRHGNRTLLLITALGDDERPVRLFDLEGRTEVAASLTEGATTGLLARHGPRPVLVTTNETGAGRVWDLSAAR